MVLILGSLMSIFLVDRVGRRKLLLPCIAAMSFVFVLQTIFVKNIQAGTATTGVKNAAVAMLFFFELFFSIGFQATVWMIPSEILPLNIRTQGSALSTGSNWVSRAMRPTHHSHARYQTDLPPLSCLHPGRFATSSLSSSRLRLWRT